MALNERIENSKKALANMPLSIRLNNYFAGGTRNDPETDNRDLEDE